MDDLANMALALALTRTMLSLPYKADAAELKKKELRWPGIEPGSIAWKATMLTIIPPTLLS